MFCCCIRRNNFPLHDYVNSPSLLGVRLCIRVTNPSCESGEKWKVYKTKIVHSDNLKATCIGKGTTGKHKIKSYYIAD